MFAHQQFQIVAKTLPLPSFLKSVNLQYNTLVRWADGTNDLSTKRLMFQVLFFFIKSCKILCKNLFILFFYKITKMKIKSFECPKSIGNYEKKNTWNISCLVDKSFVPSAQWTSVRISAGCYSNMKSSSFDKRTQ